MTPEEYQRYKEAEKAHLRKLRELKKAVRTLKRQESVSTAVEKIAEGQDLLDKQRDLVDDLALETARHEARLDIALDSSADAEHQESTEALEEELQRERAKALVKQLKRQMGAEEEEVDLGAGAETPTQENRPAEEAERRDRGRRGSSMTASSEDASRAGAGNPTGGRDDRPEKTIGRM